MSVFAKKSLGQHFLTQPTFAEKIVRLAQVASTDSVLEIGPGRGILTEALAKTGATVIAIEKDRELVPLLHEKFTGFKNVKIIEGDVLKIFNDMGDDGEPWRKELRLNLIAVPEVVRQGDPETGPISLKVVANLPYNIATEVIFRL
ncbi:MAG: rRNA adenine N-6-methyltransferase family protein, partial [Deltaproteobacteria bacterium]|nr:rRNA adenine N-6-methyltransferase family protein [Deltaproteobacteria bacterium]